MLRILFFRSIYKEGIRRLSSRFIKRNPVSIWNWIQKSNPQKISSKKKKISEYVIDETVIKGGFKIVWLWVAIDFESKEILEMSILKRRNLFIAERFLSSIVDKYREHSVSKDGGKWYPQACNLLKLKHHIHSTYGKSIIERTMQYLKDRIENFDDYFPCKRNKCKIKYVKQWFNLFVDQYNGR